MQENKEAILEKTEKIDEKNKQSKGHKIWYEDDELFEKWKHYPDWGCKIDLANIQYTPLREGYGIPCGKPNVMNTTIPAGCRAGARPCGATWKAFGGQYIPGSTERVYCSKCWVAYCLNEKKNLNYAYNELETRSLKK